MKIKTVEITKKDAHKKLNRIVVGVAVAVLLCVLLLSLSQTYPIAIPVVNMMVVCVGVLGLMVGLTILVVITLTKSEIKALNILFYGTKFILKEVKDA